MNLNLAGQNVAVFGAAKGIGRAIALGFVAEDCRVRGFDREAAPEALQAAGDIVSGDVTSLAAVQAFADAIGETDHVVFSVGAGSGKFGFPFWNVPPADWARVLDINLIGAVNVAHVFGPRMAARKRGTLLFLTSVAGQIGSPTDPPYSAAKAGLINFMQCAARDLAPHSVRANCLAPGMVRTDLNESVWAAGQRALPPEKRETYAAWAEGKILKVSPLGRWQEPAEFAAMAVFLASDHARNITGQTLNIDGGQVMHA
ncbi:MAG: SDR family oxidoreductase [Opitutaceae bacterium]|nr:SDR family oxidoreductase [Opitutaceae bacterium]